MTFDMMCTFLTMYVGAQLSKDMFDNILRKVMRAPVNLYFDVTPIEKVIRYFTGDIERCDRHFWGCLEWISHTVLDTVTKVSIACYFSPVLGIAIAANAGIVHYYGKYVDATKDEISRIQRKQHTRMHTHMGQSCDGMTVLRSFQREAKAKEKTKELIDQAKLTDMIRSGASEYYHRRMDWLSKLLYVFVGITCIGLRGALAPIYLALMFEYLEGISHQMNHTMHAYRENERNLKSLQRLLKLDSIAQEAATVEAKGDEVKVAENWPQNGVIEFKDVKMRYRPETDIVLDGLSFKVEPGQKVGIVGRTGAGKSTMSLVLSRICEVEAGSIDIDGVDTASVDLEKVRSKITVIPQDPVIFRDTIKFNLDPTGTVPE